MDFWPGLFDVGILLAVAFALGAICERLRQSALLGYLLAGLILGPNALNVVEGSQQVDGLAELGVSLLLFSIGLEFSWRRLRDMGTTALGGGTLQIVLTLGAVAGIGMALGLPLRTALVVGAAFALSSTASVLRILTMRAELDSVHGRNALGILLFQDLAIIPLVLLTNFLARPESGTDALMSLGRTVLVLGLTILVFYFLFNELAPRLLNATAMLRNRELPVLFAVVAALCSIWVAHDVGLSPAVGAFIAGMLLAESPFATQVRADLSVLRTLLVTLFFSAVGMLADPAWMLGHAGLIAAVVASVIVTKALVVWGVLRILRQSSAMSLASGICLSQIGEFAFVLAASARETLISKDLFMLMVSTLTVTLFLTPYLVSHSRAVSVLVLGGLRRLGLARALAPHAPGERNELSGHVVIIGYGPAGKKVGEVLLGKNIPVCVLDFNPKLVKDARNDGYDAHVGDASHAEVMEHVHVDTAAVVVVTIPDTEAAEKIVRLVRSRVDSANVIVRVRYSQHRRSLEIAGASVVVDEEEAVGESLGDRLLHVLFPVETQVETPVPEDVEP